MEGGGGGQEGGGCAKEGGCTKEGGVCAKEGGQGGGEREGGGGGCVQRRAGGGGAKEGGRGLGTALTTCSGSQGNIPALFPYVGMMNTTQCKGSKKKTALLHMHVLMQVRTCCFLVVD